MQQEVTIVEVDWTESVGPQSSVGLPYLTVWLRAAYLRPGLISEGRVVVLSKESQSAGWKEHQATVTLPDADTLVVELAGIGIPGRAPRVEMVLDTSETWVTSSIRVVVGNQGQAFTVQTQSSGLRGGDADGLRAVLQRILSLSGYGDGQSMFGCSGGTTR